MVCNWGNWKLSQATRFSDCIRFRYNHISPNISNNLRSTRRMRMHVCNFSLLGLLVRNQLNFGKIGFPRYIYETGCFTALFRFAARRVGPDETRKLIVIQSDRGELTQLFYFYPRGKTPSTSLRDVADAQFQLSDGKCLRMYTSFQVIHSCRKPLLL